MKDIPPTSFLRFHFYPILTTTVLNSLSPYGSGPGSHATEISPTLYFELCLTIDSLATAGEGVSEGEGPARDCRDPPALPARMLSPPHQRRQWPSFSSVPCENGVFWRSVPSPPFHWSDFPIFCGISPGIATHLSRYQY